MVERVLNGIQYSIGQYQAFLGNYDDHELNTLIDVKENAWKELEETVPPALRELETEFRQVLGVQNG